MNLVKSKELKNTIISDVQKLDTLLICRSKHEVFALDEKSYEVIWTTKIEGESHLDLDKILIFNENIVVFSVNRDQGNFTIVSINKNGKINWNVYSSVRPIDRLGVVELDGILIYRAYNSNSPLNRLVKRNLITGEEISSIDLSIKVKYVIRIENKVFLLGATGVFLFVDDKIISISDSRVISVIPSLEKIYFLSEFGERGKYNLFEITGSNSVKFINEVLLDAGDRSFLAPLIHKDLIFQSSGMNKGTLCKNLLSSEIVWSNDQHYISLQFLSFSDKHIVQFTMNESYKQEVKILNSEDGNEPCLIPFQDPIYVYSVDNSLFIGGFDNVVIFEKQE